MISERNNFSLSHPQPIKFTAINHTWVNVTWAVIAILKMLNVSDLIIPTLEAFLTWAIIAIQKAQVSEVFNNEWVKLV